MSDSRAAARAILAAFEEYQSGVRDIAHRAATHFAARDWGAARADATARLRLYGDLVRRAIAETDAIVGRSDPRRGWSAARDRYAAEVAGRGDREIAETFFSSASRLHFGTVGIDPRIEFQGAWERGTADVAEDAPRRWCSGQEGFPALAAAILEGAPRPLADPRADTERVAGALRRAAEEAWHGAAVTGADMLDTVFYRNREAYLVGCLRAGDWAVPLAIAFRSHAEGIVADAVLTTADELSIVFGFAWSYFHAVLPRPGATVGFLHRIMPLKRIDELYTAVGYNKHGKTELYRTLMHHLEQPGHRFEEAEGTRGLVMAVFTLPSLNVVLKVIKDRIAAPKRTNRHEVSEQYRRVFLNDRVGRLADAQLFQGLAFPEHCFSDDLLAELCFVAPSVVRIQGDRVVIGHLYTERRLRPLNLYLREVPQAAAEAAILDYGNAIRELAASNIFTGDLLLKNFGVSRHGRVIFYDYDELAALDACDFRHIPPPRSEDDELAAEPWYSVGEHDVFPEEFIPFLVPPGHLREVFLEAHRELLDPEWWRGMQERVACGEVPDTFPYPEGKRLA